MSTTLLLYKQVKALNRDEHKAFRLKQANECSFAAGTHLVPLAGLEFYQAARHYPIVFIGEGEKAAPIALLGLKEGQNTCVDANGQWLANQYVPAFVRRYPFVLAQGSNEDFTVCIDTEFQGWNEEEGQRLFAEDGANSEYLDEMIRFLQNFTHEMDRTRRFVGRLQELGLLEKRSFKLSHVSGESFVLSDFLAVDEEKFLKLGDEQVLALHKDGFLGWVYAHLMSLGNINQLFERHLAARSAPADAARDSDEATKAPAKKSRTKR